MNQRRFALVAGGGTGGHVVPAVAVAEALAQEGGPTSVELVASRRGIDADLLGQCGLPVTLLPGSGPGAAHRREGRDRQCGGRGRSHLGPGAGAGVGGTTASRGGGGHGRLRQCSPGFGRGGVGRAGCARERRCRPRRRQPAGGTFRSGGGGRASGNGDEAGRGHRRTGAPRDCRRGRHA